MRHYLPVVCIAGATLAAAMALLPQSAALGAQVAYPMNQGKPSPCTVTHTTTASPDVLLQGEEITVTLGVQATCPDLPGPMHVVLVLDASGSMAGQKNQMMKQGAALLVRGLDMPSNPDRKVGVVEYNTLARRLCSLTNDQNQALSCVNRVGANGGTRIDLGIREGLRVMSDGRAGLNRDDLTEVMIVLSDGSNNAGCAPVLTAARQARGQGILLIAICIGNDCDEQCLRQVASGPRFYYSVPDPRDLASVFDAVLRRLLQDVVARLAVTYTWGDRLSFVADSANPHQSEPTAPVDWLRWEQASVAMPASGFITYTARLLPLHAGTQRAGTEATGEMLDRRGRTLSWRFDLPLISVLDPAAPPTATVTPTPSLTPTPTPTATATPTPKPIYLPKAVRSE